MTFRVGQKVVCVDDSSQPMPGTARWGKCCPVKGRIYTVSAVGLVHCLDPESLPCIRVEELDRRPEEPLWAHRFRPIVDRKTSISIFTQMLAPSRRKETVA